MKTFKQVTYTVFTSYILKHNYVRLGKLNIVKYFNFDFAIRMR